MVPAIAIGHAKPEDVPMARCAGKLQYSRNGTDSEPPPIPTQLEAAPKSVPAAVRPGRAGRVREGVGLESRRGFECDKGKKCNKENLQSQRRHIFCGCCAEEDAEYHARRHSADGRPINGVLFMLGVHTGEGSKHHDGKGSADGEMLGIGVAAYALQLQYP